MLGLARRPPAMQHLGVGDGEPEQGWESRVGTPWWAPNHYTVVGGGTTANEACFWLLPIAALALGKDAEIKYKTPFPPESLV